MRMYVRRLFTMTLFLFMAGVQTAFGEGSQVNPPGQPADRWYIPEWVETLQKKIDSMWTTLQDLMSGKFIHDAINKTVVLFVDEALTPLYGLFAKCYLFTPQIAKIDIVHTGWTVISIVCMVLLIVGSAILASQIIKGKKEMGKLLKAFCISMVAVFFSMTAMNWINVGINWLTQQMFEGMLETANVNYQGLDGQQVLKAIILGADVFKEPAYAAKSTAQIVMDTEGGLVTLFCVTLFIVLPLFAISGLKILVLFILAIFVGAWITGTAYTGRAEVLVGFFNLYIRTLLVGFFLALHWGIFVKTQTDYGRGAGLSAEIGLAPIWIAMITVIGLVVLLFFFWFKPIMEAAKQPLTLNGGAVIEKAGEWGQSASQVVNYVGKRFGSEGLQSRGLSWSNTSQKVIEFGRRMQEQQMKHRATRMASALTGGVSEAIQNIEYSLPTEWSKETGTMVSALQKPTEYVVSQESDADIVSVLTDKKFKQAAQLQFRDTDRAAAGAVMQRISKEKPGALKWNSQTGSLLIQGEDSNEVQNIIQQFSNAQLAAQQVRHGMTKDGVFVDQADKSIHQVGDDRKAAAALASVQKVLQTSSKLKLNPDEAREAYKYLQQKQEEHPWISSIQLKNDELWIPSERLQDAAKLLENVVNQRKLVRIDMPQTSSFLGELVHYLKEQHPQLNEAVSAEAKNNFILVQQEEVPKFYKAFETFRKNRVPFWRTSSGAIKVIVDGVPVDYGGIPKNGMDMGSFERLQKEAIRNKFKEG
ncbi:hypothetical protein [Paenibacillus elgii]|uniref:hypothetical protein n=1 Tax=Paenibacillus elgii TaxID=189691 RepID=UPI0013D7B85D|nr:hypothetical protein [Paenibacillus elgii]